MIGTEIQQEYDTLATRYSNGTTWLLEQEGKGAMGTEHPGHAAYDTNLQKWQEMAHRLRDLVRLGAVETPS